MSKKIRPQKKSPPQKTVPWAHYALLSVVCVLVIGIFVWSAQPGVLESDSPRAENSYYNLLVQGFRAGQLNLKREAPPALARLSNPYDPAVNTHYVWGQGTLCYDMSYYKGKLYLYFGVPPALVLFWPYVLITGHYLPATDAVIIFFSCSLFIAAFLLYALWRRYYPETGIWVVAAGILAMGLCSGMLEILSSCDVYEVAKSCGLCFTMIALIGVWQALHGQKRAFYWLLLASLAYGLAIASRQSLLFGAMVLLIPAAYAWRETSPHHDWRRVGMLLAAAAGPLVLVGFGLMFYNNARFGNPFEFGWHYQLTNIDQNAATAHQFNLQYLWFNFRFYFLHPLRWIAHFPFLQVVPMQPVPAGYGGIGAPYGGILVNYPIVWLALAAPLVWKSRTGNGDSPLRWFTIALCSLFVICAVTICLFLIASSRYQFDFLPVLILLAAFGILVVERTLGARPSWRLAARCGWCLLLAYSVAFSAMAAVQAHSATDFNNGTRFTSLGQMDKAVGYYQRATVLNPQSSDICLGLGRGLFEEGQTGKAMDELRRALAIDPNSAKVHYYVASYLFRLGWLDDAIAECQKAIEIEPDSAIYRATLGNALFQKGQVDDAISQFQKAMAIDPTLVEAHNGLGSCYLQTGRLDDAIAQYQTAIKVKPEFVEAYNNLASARRRKGQGADAVALYQKALEIEPQFVAARINLAWTLATWPDASVRNGSQAVALAEQVNQLSGGKNIDVLHTLAAAYAEAGRFPEATSTAEEALALAVTQNADMATKLKKEIALYQKNSPYHAASD